MFETFLKKNINFFPFLERKKSSGLGFFLGLVEPSRNRLASTAYFAIILGGFWPVTHKPTWTGKNLILAVRETSVSRHSRVPIKDLPLYDSAVLYGGCPQKFLSGSRDINNRSNYLQPILCPTHSEASVLLCQNGKHLCAILAGLQMILLFLGYLVFPFNDMQPLPISR